MDACHHHWALCVGYYKTPSLGHHFTLSMLIIYLILLVVKQYHVQSQHHLVMGVGEQYVLWITVLSAWLEQILRPYPEQY